MHKIKKNAMENSFRMSLFMPPISPIKDKATGRIVKNATLTPLRTVELNEVYKLVTANAKLAALTLAVRYSLPIFEYLVTYISIFASD